MLYNYYYVDKIYMLIQILEPNCLLFDPQVVWPMLSGPDLFDYVCHSCASEVS